MFASGEDGLQDLPILFKRNRHHRGSIYTVGWNKTGNLLATGKIALATVVFVLATGKSVLATVNRYLCFNNR